MPVQRLMSKEAPTESPPRLARSSDSLPSTFFPAGNFTVSLFQSIGDRQTQEDRFLVAPDLESGRASAGNGTCAMFGVFDGTVGDFASDNVQDLVMPALLSSASWRQLRSRFVRHRNEKELLLSKAVQEMYRGADEALITKCAQHRQDYATCTSVTLLMVGDMLAVGHLGDSRIIFGQELPSGELVGRAVTLDHKPDQLEERKRIERCGGAVVRLPNHNNKPFIRGGDFLSRKELGDTPMQIQYSRAFGGKDLKKYGLSCEPDVQVFNIKAPQQPKVRWAILASDGLWDVLEAQKAVDIAVEAFKDSRNPAEACVEAVLSVQRDRKARADNITAVCVHFH